MEKYFLNKLRLSVICAMAMGRKPEEMLERAAGNDVLFFGLDNDAERRARTPPQRAEYPRQLVDRQHVAL